MMWYRENEDDADDLVTEDDASESRMFLSSDINV